ncbi:MAG: tetratricopeptide repeat protein [Candidatus Lokiarchaeota archaeon]|nr:tetratricopeptide repeat protein [Candidatus Harpocratesius repetitus]
MNTKKTNQNSQSIKFEEQARMNYMLGCSYLEEGDFHKAEHYFELAIKQQPLYLDAWNNLGVSYFNSQDYVSAEYCFQKSLSINPNHEHALINICKVFLQTERYENFDRYFRQIQKPLDENLELIRLKITYLKFINEFSEAIKIIEDYFKNNSLDKDLVFQLAELYEYNGKINKSIEVLEKYQLIRPNDVELLNNLGYYCELEGKFHKAVEYYQDALKLEEMDPYLWNNLGNVYREIGENKKALKIYRKSLQISPNELEIVNNYCDLALDMNLEENWSKYIPILENKGNQKNKEIREVLDTLMKIYQKLKEKENIEKIRKKILNFEQIT